MLRVAVVGNGGREHALRHVLARTATVVDLAEADLVVIGPEQPLVDGLADQLRASGQLVFGPGADGAELEASKGWMKEVLNAAGVPTARHRTFTRDTAGGMAEFLAELPGAAVKTDYLAAGKGVLVSTDRDALLADARAKVEHGAVVIEEYLAGPELSVFGVCNGKDFVLLPEARDHKRVGDGDTGPNTGGMGAFSPVPGTASAVTAAATMIGDTLAELQRRGIDYRGVLYAGLVLTPDGPKMLEYNVRFGDPESQVVLPRLTSDVAELLRAAAAGDPLPAPAVSPDACLTVVLASEGYPTSTRTGDLVTGIEDAEAVPGVTVFRAGISDDDRTAGGRVLNVTAMAPTIEEARARAYEAITHISFPGMHYRKDIAST